MMRNLKVADLHHRFNSLSIKELILYEMQGILLVCIFGYFFYRSIIITIICFPLSILFLAYKSRELKKRKNAELSVQFKEVLISVSGSVRAGYSLENAFIEAENEMKVFYGNKSQIAKELSILRLGLNNGKTLPVLINQMGKRNESDYIEEFANILVIGKQTGGNLTQIIDSYVHMLEEKLQVEQEIETIISSKKYEQKIMNCIPFVIIFYIDITSKGFFDVLYNNILGRIVMSICLLIYIVGVFWAERITDINI